MIDAVRWLRKDQKIICAPDEETVRMPGCLRLLDQTRLPGEVLYFTVNSLPVLVDAIKRLAVRGAPAIGCGAALGMAAIAESYPEDMADFSAALFRDAEPLASARPTAVNLRWAVERMLRIFREAAPVNVLDARQILRKAALEILAEDIALCRSIGQAGLPLLPDGATVLTHCNAGALATGDFGTALAPVYAATEAGRKICVYSDETRPLLQGSRLTAWELHRAGCSTRRLSSSSQCSNVTLNRFCRRCLSSATNTARRTACLSSCSTSSLCPSVRFRRLRSCVSSSVVRPSATKRHGVCKS